MEIAIIVKVIRTFKHDSRAFIEQRLINNLVGICRTNAAGFEAYIHTNLADKFVDWLNDNKLEMGKNSNGKERWATVTLDGAAQLDFKESDNLCPLFIGRIKIGYARGLEHQIFYKNFSNQVFSYHFVRTLHI